MSFRVIMRGEEPLFVAMTPSEVGVLHLVNRLAIQADRSQRREPPPVPFDQLLGWIKS